jgi:hypothetical protein
MTFASATTARHAEAIRVEAFYHGYGLRLADGRLVADRTGRSPETFETRAAAEKAAERIAR